MINETEAVRKEVFEQQKTYLKDLKELEEAQAEFREIFNMHNNKEIDEQLKECLQFARMNGLTTPPRVKNQWSK